MSDVLLTAWEVFSLSVQATAAFVLIVLGVSLTLATIGSAGYGAFKAGQWIGGKLAR